MSPAGPRLPADDPDAGFDDDLEPDLDPDLDDLLDDDPPGLDDNLLDLDLDPDDDAPAGEAGADLGEQRD